MAAMTGMIHGIPFASVERVPISLGVERSFETQEFYYGNTLVRLFADSQVTCNLELEDTQSSGIAPNSTISDSGHLEQAQLQRVEETNNILKVPRRPAETIDEDIRLLKALTAAVRWLGMRETYTLSGKGSQKWGASAQGTKPGSLTVSAAQGAFALSIPATAKIEQVGKNSTNNGDVDTWNATLFAYIANDGSPTTPMITLPADVLALMPENAVLVSQETFTMSGDYKQNVKHTYQVTAHLTD